MIKLIGVFDKAIEQKLTKNSASEEDLLNLITEAISEIEDIPRTCPVCEMAGIDWLYQRSRTQRIFWNRSEYPVYVPLPLYVFKCERCGHKGIEMISTDLTIDKTEFSFHYLFSLIRFWKYPSGLSAADSTNLLYSRMSEETFRRWVNRYNHDYRILQEYFPELREEDLLQEKLSFRELFFHFYQHEHRFFMHNSSAKVILRWKNGEFIQMS